MLPCAKCDHILGITGTATLEWKYQLVKRIIALSSLSWEIYLLFSLRNFIEFDPFSVFTYLVLAAAGIQMMSIYHWVREYSSDLRNVWRKR